jgi:Ceramidase
MEHAIWPLGLYCERTMLGFWQEPLNTWSNLAFLLVAFFAWRRWSRADQDDLASLALIMLAAIIGFGSFAFHAMPSRITVLMDVIPIQVFVLTALFFALRRYLALPVWAAALALLLFFFGSGWIIGQIGSNRMAGGIGYLPPLIAMPLIAAFARLREQRMTVAGAAHAPDDDALALRAVSRALAIAAGVFALSLALRTYDQPLCPINPFGLHFLWHCLNAAVLFLLIVGQLQFGRKRSVRA